MAREHSLPPNGTGYPAPDLEWVARSYRDAGMEPPWTRVYRAGVDVTDQPPETWPWPWNDEKPRPSSRS